MRSNTYFCTLSRSFRLRMRNVSDKNCRQNHNTNFVLSNVYFENLAVFEIMWENIVERGGPQMTVWRMRIACWITKPRGTHSQYIYSLIYERASVLRYTYIVCLVIASSVLYVDHFCRGGEVSTDWQPSNFLLFLHACRYFPEISVQL
jgi:hypothetical protein